MIFFRSKPEDKFKEIFLKQGKSEPDSGPTNNDIIASYISYLLTPDMKIDKDVGIITSITKHTSFLVWRLRNSSFKLGFREKTIDEIFSENKNDSNCKECNMHSIVKDNEIYKNSRYSYKIEESIKKKENTCESCKPNMTAIISETPEVLGYEDSIKLKNFAKLEQTDKEFCKLVYAFLYEKNRNNVWGSQNVPVQSPKQGYDIIILIKDKNSIYKLVQVEVKFRNIDNIDDNDYRRFLEKHIFLERKFKEFSKEIKILSVLFDPYNIENFNKKIEETELGTFDKAIISKALKEKRIKSCFSSLSGKKQIQNFLKKKNYQNIIEHMKDLHNILK